MQQKAKHKLRSQTVEKVPLSCLIYLCVVKKAETEVSEKGNDRALGSSSAGCRPRLSRIPDIVM